MGTFTTIIHPDDGRELQIKTGGDVCDTYHLGDDVKWDIGYYPQTGALLDGVYSSYSDNGVDDWVIIKDHKVHAVHKYVDCHCQDCGDYCKNNECESSLLKFYDVKLPEDSLWSKKAWNEKNKLEKKSKKEFDKFKKSISNLNPNEQFAALLSYPLREMRNYISIGRKLFKIEKMK